MKLPIYKKMLTATLIIGSMATPLIGGTAPTLVAEINGRNFAVTPIHTVSGTSGQDMDSFALQVAKPLQEYTRNHGTEACAMICRKQDAFSARIITIGSHVACPIADLCEDGATPTGIGIHSHTTQTRIIANEADQAVLGRSKKAGQSFRGGNPEQFSDEDYDSGEGYMVSGTRLYHQKSRRSARIVGTP